MTALSAATDDAVSIARHLKEQSMKDGYVDLSTQIIVSRGGQLVAVIEMLEMERDAMLALTAFAAHGYDADMITLTFETYHTAGPAAGKKNLDNPLTGKPWGPGEMQDAALNHDGIAKGWVSEALLIYVGNRAGDAIQHILPYRRVGGRKVEWVAPDGGKIPPRWGSEEADVRAEGIVPNALNRIMAGKSASAERAGGFNIAEAAQRLGLDYVRARASQDCAVTKMIMAPPPEFNTPWGPVVVGLDADRPGSVRAQILKESMPWGSFLGGKK